MFHDYAVNAVHLYKECFKRWSVRACAFNVTLHDDAVVRLLEGLYPVYLEDWLRIFRRDQIMVFRNEDYAEDIKGHIEAAFNFLDLAPLNDTLMAAIAEHDSSNVGVNYGVVGPMLPETIAVLNEFYEPFIHRLAELLQDNKFLWKDIVVT
ncbi:hypothetical protein C0Q70_14692 [Pomacea canaliculata]|uniref:Sulfotransferase domain-containing protein n=1 Tax=Pomacea canaliculata TaxID=400727 RepID=A0A2T7NSU3_POMCA|nr:carbohydrate sulfotransferase 15-like [Pomacea canaliculata]PVD24222.1 hypothetical protein C0Q70_14692 [Pomacea canaliculata]